MVEKFRHYKVFDKNTRMYDVRRPPWTRGKDEPNIDFIRKS